MGGRTITWSGPITPDEVKELAKELIRSSELSESALFISESAIQELLHHPDVRNTFIWMDPKSLVDGYITIYGLRITFYREPNDN